MYEGLQVQNGDDVSIDIQVHEADNHIRSELIVQRRFGATDASIRNLKRGRQQREEIIHRSDDAVRWVDIFKFEKQQIAK